MIIRFDSCGGDNAHTVREPIVLVYGDHRELSLEFHDPDLNPVDVECRGAVRWTIQLLQTPGTEGPALEVVEAYDNLASGSTVTFEMGLDSVELYRYVAGRRDCPARLELDGRDETGTPVFRAVVPVVLKSAFCQRRPVDVSTALMREMQMACASCRAAARYVEGRIGELMRKPVPDGLPDQFLGRGDGSEPEWRDLPEHIGDCPDDGRLYVRRHGAWVELHDALGLAAADEEVGQ